MTLLGKLRCYVSKQNTKARNKNIIDYYETVRVAFARFKTIIKGSMLVNNQLPCRIC